MSIMYKVQMMGPQNVLHKYEPFLLNPPICMLLYLGRTKGSSNRLLIYHTTKYIKRLKLF